MKTLIKSIICAATLLPLGQLQAKDFGGLTPKQTFTFSVTGVESVKVTRGASKPTPMLRGIPAFTKGQAIKFTIGAKGQLMSKGFSIPFKMASAETSENIYSNKPKAPTVQSMKNGVNARIYKDTTGMPVSGSLIFSKQTGPAMKPYDVVVTYTLEKM